jgi:CheY-like chemotaxis protein/two-component sensor histidine kinase
MLSHELRNPLATIRSAAELLKLNPGDEQRLRRTQEVLERQSVHMAKLLDGLLDVSRIIRGKIHIERTTLDLGAVCRDVCEDVQDRVANRNLRLRTDLPSEPVWILGDVVRITQIIDNLMSNAVKYTPDGGTVSVKLTTSDGTAVLSVHDTGIGIPGDLLPDVFDVFRQAAQTLDRTSGGRGLGLALVKSLVDLHGGTIVARSEGKDRGAEFVVTLPLAPGQSTGPVEIATPAPDPLSILIIEDNIDSAEMLREVLEYSGHHITIASSGEEGVAIARENSPDLILCDLGLPAGMSGYDVARAIRDRAETRDLRLVALSGYARPEDRIQCMEAGFDDHITKPVDVRTIAGVVARLAGREVEHEDSSSPPQRF